MDEELRQQIVDDEQVRLLSIGFFVTAGLTAVVSLFVLLYTLFIAFVFAQITQQPGQAGPPAFLGRLIGILGVCMTLAMFGVAALQALAGQRLKQRRSRTFCMVMAGISCLNIPYGTLLGISTFIVLGRPSVRRTFTNPPST